MGLDEVEKGVKVWQEKSGEVEERVVVERMISFYIYLKREANWTLM